MAIDPEVAVGIYQTVYGQCFNAGVSCSDIQWELGIPFVTIGIGKELRLLLIPADTIQHPEGGNWVASIKAIDRASAVVVFHGYSQIPGSLAFESSGNPIKEDYRRIAWAIDAKLVKNLGSGLGLYAELPYRLTELNIAMLEAGRKFK